MKHHWLNLKYLLKHKFWVFRCGLWTGAPIWRLIIHDWSKFGPLEWTAYANHFYRDGGVWKFKRNKGQHSPGDAKDEFNRAWLRHIHKNPHHWQHWVLMFDDDGYQALEMPENFVREMVADWMGAGLAQKGIPDILHWYDQNKNRMILHENTRRRVREILDSLPSQYFQLGRGKLP